MKISFILQGEEERDGRERKILTKEENIDEGGGNGTLHRISVRKP